MISRCLISRPALRTYVLSKLPRIDPNAPGSAKKPNRFAKQYNEKKWRKFPKRDKDEEDRKADRLPKPVDIVERSPAADAERYKQIRQRLNEKARVDKPKAPKKPPKPAKAKPAAKIKISIPTFVTVSNLANLINVPFSRMLAKMEELGFENLAHNYIMDKENATLVADEFGFEVTMSDETGMDLFPAAVVPDKLEPRPPVVTIMGHVDHGKTTILDYLRKSLVVAGEFGGITQHIGAFSVVTPVSKKKITFLDTPGHAAFLSMRERGAIVTDVVVLVVAADDSVMPQTVEAIKHAKKAGVPMIVAINKCDKHGLKLERVLADLARHDIDIEDYGGETQTVKVSGKTGQNMDKLEEAVITLSELAEFKAERSGVAAEAWVLELSVAKGLGNVATVLVRRGTVRPGCFLVAGTTYCKVRGMKDEHGRSVQAAGPSTPVQVWGWKELPQAGERILEAVTEAACRKVVANRATRQRQIQAAKDIESINEKRQKEVEELQRAEKANELKLAGLDPLEFLEAEAHTQRVKYIVKADVFGSAEAVKESIDGLGNDEVAALVVAHEAGAPGDADIRTAEAVGASVLCFNVKVPKEIASRAAQLGVKIHEHNVIYRLIEEVTLELTARLAPRIETTVLAEAEVKSVFHLLGKNKSVVHIAGCKVASGDLKRLHRVRVRRGGDIVFTGTLLSLKHVKQDVAEAKRGTECGLSLNGWDEFKEGDVVEAFEETEMPRFL